MAWTAASEELKVGSEQELSGIALLSLVKEAAADLRLLFNSFSSLDILVSYERGEGSMWIGGVHKIGGAVAQWKEDQKTMCLPQEWSLLHGPVQSAYSKTERAEAAENVVCRVFDRVPVAK